VDVTHAITEIQPWASELVFGAKDVENRTWSPPRHIIGRRIAIHAGKKVSEVDACTLGHNPAELPTGVILGSVHLYGYLKVWPGGRREAHGLTDEQIVTAFKSPWRFPVTYRAMCAWFVGGKRPLVTPVPCRGAQMVWKIPADVREMMAREALLKGGV
jgi:hypothetical protein